ncbi:hypothetical protein GIB67_025471 [Kingdonia uniflora]|uniref:Uncharacterized protein n=1 Tax=Kingdonia uniflora TaxID=39325 RepID=A0A7J7PE97_9MAGN|nr:hypothetical protein GIB67_025471 [Kingdonia uniflora]
MGFSQALCLLLLVFSNTLLVWGCYTSIFSFGDSLADTGNLLNSEANTSPLILHPPYGETYFHRPTGRASDGRLIIDYIAQSVGLPLLSPYLGNHGSEDFRQGVNFAVVGATALDAAFLNERDIVPSTNNSLEIVTIFSKLHYFLWARSEEMIFEQRNVEEILTLVPKVIDTIYSAIKMLIDNGAVTLVVPGNLPIGCSAAYLSIYESQNKDDYDPLTGCLNWLNQFSKYHNKLFQQELDRLRKLYLHITIIYADFYNPAMQIYQSPAGLGFIKGALTACCGGGGPYNYNVSAKCGNQGASTCDDPSMFVSWDGTHLTEAAYRWIASSLLRGPFTTPRFSSSCLSAVACKI